MEEKRKLTIEEQQKISYSILCDVADFCEAHSIKYYLACGTLLGAIRHEGFIPWDDDVDIFMPRPDYNRFISEYNNKQYKVLTPSKGMFYYTKVFDPKTIKQERSIDYTKYEPIGIDIDIFPLDGMINDEEELKTILKKVERLEAFLRLSNQPIFYKKGIRKAFNRVFARIMGSKRIIKMIENISQKYDYNKSEYVCRIRNSANGFTGILHKKDFDEPILKRFEDREFYVPKNYDKLLTNFYGDYMKLPPEDRRHSSHNGICYKI